MSLTSPASLLRGADYPGVFCHDSCLGELGYPWEKYKIPGNPLPKSLEENENSDPKIIFLPCSSEIILFLFLRNIKEMNEPQIQSFPDLLITDISMWCIFSHLVLTVKLGSWKAEVWDLSLPKISYDLQKKKKFNSKKWIICSCGKIRNFFVLINPWFCILLNKRRK